MIWTHRKAHAARVLVFDGLHEELHPEVEELHLHRLVLVLLGVLVAEIVDQLDVACRNRAFVAFVVLVRVHRTCANVSKGINAVHRSLTNDTVIEVYRGYSVSKQTRKWLEISRHRDAKFITAFFN